MSTETSVAFVREWADAVPQVQKALSELANKVDLMEQCRATDAKFTYLGRAEKINVVSHFRAMVQSTMLQNNVWP